MHVAADRHGRTRATGASLVAQGADLSASSARQSPDHPAGRRPRRRRRPARNRHAVPGRRAPSDADGRCRSASSMTLSLELDHGGPTVFEIEVDQGPKELTLANNRAVTVINGVRDRLRVLLVSGEPHPGERTWRNLLKSDPAVDLVHFTILRPPEKQDGTPINELSLIAFPIRELFEVKLRRVRPDHLRPLPPARRAAAGLFRQHRRLCRRRRRAAGRRRRRHSTALWRSDRTPLQAVLPAEPTGQVLEAGFQPQLTAVGQRHPVTAGLCPARRGEQAELGPLVPPDPGATAMRGVTADERRRRRAAAGPRPRRRRAAWRSCSPTRSGSGRAASRAAGRRPSCCAASRTG